VSKIDLARKAIESHLADNWTATDICYEGIDPADFLDDLDEFIMVAVSPTSVIPASIADGPQSRFHFIIQIDIYTPINRGTATANGYADDLIDSLVGKTIDGVRIRQCGNIYRRNADTHLRMTMLFHSYMD